MDEHERKSAERERREASKYLESVVQALRRDGMPRMPGARRLGGSRFGHGWIGGPGRVVRPAKA
jgi:hypothetical protein